MPKYPLDAPHIFTREEWKRIPEGYREPMLQSTYDELKAKFPDRWIGKYCLLTADDCGTCLVFEGLHFLVEGISNPAELAKYAEKRHSKAN